MADDTLDGRRTPGHLSRRNSHFDEQRASMGSRASYAHSRSHSREMPQGRTTPTPFEHRRQSSSHGLDTAELDRRRTSLPPLQPTQSLPEDEYTLPTDYGYLGELTAHSPVDLYPHQSREDEMARAQRRSSGRARGSYGATEDLTSFDHEQDLTELTAIPLSSPHTREEWLEDERYYNIPSPERRDEEQLEDSDQTAAAPEIQYAPPPKRASRFATQLYTVSYLILFAIWGTLARIGLQTLTFYPGAPVDFSVLWANFSGSFFMGFLAEDRMLFREEWGSPTDNTLRRRRSRKEDEEKVVADEAKASHAKVKKTIPLYIGLATGFCGSFTSFSSFIRDVFLALSNNLPTPINHPYTGTPPSTSSTVHRNGGYSFMAILAVIIVTITVCLGALKFGAHLALYLDPYTPTIPFRLTRRRLDRLAVVLGWGCWLGAVLLAIWPPHANWRGEAVLACVFAPVGCLLRFYASLHLNGIVPAFPLGTFAVNVFGTAVLGMAYDLQHVQLGAGVGSVGGGRIGCQVLQGLMDGFCGSLTTVSTWMVELTTLRRGHGYVYGGMSVLVSLALLVAIMGSVRWTVGFSTPACVT